MVWWALSGRPGGGIGAVTGDGGGERDLVGHEEPGEGEQDGPDRCPVWDEHPLPYWVQQD